MTSVAGESNTDNNCSSSRAVRVWSESSPATIPDANLRAAIEAALSKASGATITKGDMTRLRRLDARSADISDLTGLEFATNLTRLELGVNNITNISALSGLINLTWLGLDNNRITDVSALSDLTNLTSLGLSRNQIKSISALSDLTNLTWLTLSGNQIKSISALRRLTNLEVLYLGGGTNITDISALRGLTNLTGLELSSTNITDISALRGLTNLTGLELSSTNITDISALRGLTNLTGLKLNFNNITDVSSLSGLTNLTGLELNFNNITDISALRGLTKLTELELRGNPLRSSSINDHIPALERSGVTVFFDSFRESDFDIELVFLADFTQRQKRVLQYAARRWMSIIREDLPDYTFTQGWSGECGDHSYAIPSGERIDDLRIYITSYDGYEDTAAGWASPRVLRRTSSQTVLGCMGFNLKHIDSYSFVGTGLHEIGHVLGIGSIFYDLGFLQDPNGDPHFNGPLAIAAFNDAGGRDYAGKKVPMQKMDGAHWRDSVFGVGGELMTPSGGRGTLSAITIQALADLGYSVDVTQADPYTLPSVAAKASAKIAAPSTHAQPEFSCGVGEQREPIYVVDEQGNIIRTLHR